MRLREKAIAAGLLIVFLTITLLLGSVATAGDVPGSKPPGEQSSEFKGESETVNVSQWVSLNGERPTTYEEWASKQVPVPTRILKDEVPTVQSDLQAQASVPVLSKVLVLVNSGVYPSKSVGITQYISDLEADGLDPELVVGTFATPEDLRNFLIGKHAQGVIGTALVGDFPSAWYEHHTSYVDEFPSDVFLEDLDGTWTDTDSDGIYDVHTDSDGLEMFVGRIKGSGMTLDGATETGLLSNYFRKDHAYRTGALTLPRQALVYLDDDFKDELWAVDDLRLAYPGSQTTLVNDPETTRGSDYLSRIKNNGYQWVLLAAHSWWGGHLFYYNDGHNNDDASSSDIEAGDPHVFFYVLYACNAARYTETDCIGNWYVMSDSYGLGVFGSTTFSGVFRFSVLFNHVRGGGMLGSSLVDCYNTPEESGLLGDHWTDLVLLGDPFLRTFKFNPPTVAGIDPNWGTRGGAAKIIYLAGSNFYGTPNVQLKKSGQSTITASSVTVDSPELIECSISIPLESATGPWDVVVTNPDGRSAKLPGGFTVNEPPAPTVTSIAPNWGTRGNTENMPNLTGTNFFDTPTVHPTVQLKKSGQKFTITASSVTVDSPEKIECSITIPLGAETGPWDVVVRNPDGQSATLPGGFTVNEPPAPTVTSIAPNWGTRGNTENMPNLTGTNFFDTPTVHPTVQLKKSGQSTITASSVTVDSPEKIECSFSIPLETATGPWDVVVTNPDGQSATLPGGFTVNVTSFTVTSVPVGRDPSAFGVNYRTNKIYVANQGEGTVSVINGKTDSVVATVPVGNQPNAIGVNDRTNKIYVANAWDTRVSVIDGKTDSVVATVTVDVAPIAVGVNTRTNKIYVACLGGTVSVINGKTDSVVATVPVGYGVNLNAVGVNDRTNKIYVANQGGTVSVINGKTDIMMATVPVGNVPRAVKVNTRTNKVYVLNGGDGTNPGTVSVINGKTDSVMATVTVGVGPSAIEVNTRTNKVYVANRGNGTNPSTVSVINGKTDSVVASVPVGVGPNAIGVNYRTNKVYVSNYGKNNNPGTVSVINGKTDSVVANVLVGGGPNAIGVNYRTNKVYVANARDGTVSVISEQR